MNQLLQKIHKKIKPQSYLLDLGYGQGRDSLFMAKNGFKIVAVDKSKEAILNLKKSAEKERLKIKILCQNIENFKIKKDKYFVIQLYNSLQFIEKTAALKIIKDIKNK